MQLSRTVPNRKGKVEDWLARHVPPVQSLPEVVQRVTPQPEELPPPPSR